MMTTAAEILVHALALPAGERASLAHSLLHSLPAGPRVYSSELELAEELEARLRDVESGKVATMDARESIRLAREALDRSRRG